jgi:hypothetical protein
MKSEEHLSDATMLPGEESSDDSLLSFDLPKLIRMLKFGNSWERGELCSKVLLKSPDKKIVLAAIPEGTEVTSSKSDDPITLQIIEGSLMLKTRKVNRSLIKGHLLTLAENTKFKLASKEESVLLITVAANAMATEYNRIN